MIDTMFLFTKIYLYIEELQYCTQQYEINKIRKYKMSHINKMVNSQIKTKKTEICVGKFNKNKKK